MQTETVEKETLDLIKRLMADEQLNDFNLVGGTALALLIGHRKSVDIDLFCPNDFDRTHLANHLIKNYATDRINVTKIGIFAVIEKVKVDILAHKHPLVDPIETREGIRLVSLKEIGAMKLNAMHGNGTRLKDFVDIYALLERHPLKALLDHAAAKYPDMHPALAKQGVIYHQDIDFAKGVDFIGDEIPWPVIVKRLKDAYYHPNKLFQPMRVSQKKTEKNGQTEKQAKRRKHRPKW